MSKLIRNFVLGVMAVLMSAGLCFGEERFSTMVGNVEVGNVKEATTYDLPFIVWGGDMFTFYANGGLMTKPGSIFAKQGSKFNLVPGDDFIQQVKNYLEGKTPFLRGTFRMLGQASEVLGSDPRTKPVIFVQLTWSAGDHCVVREDIKDLKDFKGKTFAMQTGGPHVGMFDDILTTAELSWDDVNIIWCDDLTGTPNSPAEKFRADPSISACFVITPDMIGLCGGLQNVGSGAEGSVKGSRVGVSTAEMSYSIADVYAVRKDFYDANRALVEKLAAGLLKAQEEVTDLRKTYENTGSKQYMALLQMTQDIYGEDVIPTLEEDAHGLLLDCTPVGHPGNVAFFTDKANLHGFDVFQKKALDLATSRGYAKVRQGMIPSPLDWNSKTFTDNYLTKTQVTKTDRFHAEAVISEIEELTSGGGLDSSTIISFSIGFAPDQTEFDATQYGVEFNEVLKTVYKGGFGNAVIAIRGHSDPTMTLLTCVRAGKAKGTLRQSGVKGNYSYSIQGKALNLEATNQVIALIGSGAFDGVAQYNPREIMQAALNLSRIRAEAVRDSFIKFAKDQGYTVDDTQIQPIGAGIREPFIAKPVSLEEAAKNRRVTLDVVRVSAEAVNASDFDF